MEKDPERFERVRNGTSVEISAARRLAAEFSGRYKLFQESRGTEITFPLFITDYSDETGDATISYSDYTIQALISPRILEDELRKIFRDDVARFPKPISYTDRATLPEMTNELPPSLEELRGKHSVQLNTIFPLMSELPFLEQIRRIQISSISKSGKFEDPKGEIWIAERWAHESLANEIWEQLKKDSL